MAKMSMAELVKRVKRLDEVGERACTELSGEIEAILKANCRAGHDAHGRPWAPRQDGKPALVNAADSVTCHQQGSTIVMEVSGPEAIHDEIKNRGARHPQAKGRKRKRRDVTRFDAVRQILPPASRPLPEDIRELVHAEINKAVGKILGGR